MRRLPEFQVCDGGDNSQQHRTVLLFTHNSTLPDEGCKEPEVVINCDRHHATMPATPQHPLISYRVFTPGCRSSRNSALISKQHELSVLTPEYTAF